MKPSSRVPRLAFDRGGSTAVELAMVFAPFAIFLFAIFGVALQFYLQQALDYAVQGAARQVQLGAVPASTEAQFVTQVLCPQFSAFQPCTNLYADVRPVSDYESLSSTCVTDGPSSTNTRGFGISLGAPGQLMYVHVVYMAPSIGGTLFGNSPGGTTPLVANAAFSNENPAGAPVTPPPQPPSKC